jgi:branched-chain amino acid transport system ATP-binding protein
MIAVQCENQRILEVKDLECFYGGLKVLKGASLRLIEGQIAVLFGPNGHGKSTLLKAISGIHAPSSGSILFMGQEIRGFDTEKTVEMGLAYIPEDRHIFSEMTVEENLILGAFNRRARRSIKQNFEFVFSLFPRMKERKNQMASTLSGGESRMLAVGRGLMSCASLLLIDEPSIGLSPLLKKDVFRAIGVIGKETDATILVVEQEVDYALKLAKVVYLLRKGRIIMEKEARLTRKEEIEKAYF